MSAELLTCFRCGHICTDNEIEPRQVFAGNREEPPEYVDVCPTCGAEDTLDEVPI